MEIPDELLCLFSADINEQDGGYTVTIPEHEVTTGNVDNDRLYRVALLETTTTNDHASDRDKSQRETDTETDPTPSPEPPVEVGEHRTVEIEGIGEQGDGIARVDRGYVIIVPETEQRERVTVEINDVTPNVAFGEVVDRKAYYE
ncbi:deoxyribonuclease [halophilic archaeon]|nr:deoxyribonuclease [halophilic archaeon]